MSEVDTRPKPTKQQRKLLLGLLNRQIALMDEEGEYFWKEHPWFEDPKAERKIIEKPEWEEEKRVIKKKLNKVWDEIDKLIKQMYPPEHYPEMHGAQEQPSLIEGMPSKMHNIPQAEPRSVEDMTMQEIEEVFDTRKKTPEPLQAKTTAGAEILKRFEERRNRRRGY